MVRTRKQVERFKNQLAEHNANRLMSYQNMKQYYRLPYRACVGRYNYDTMRHPNRSWVAALEQIRRYYPDIPLAPVMCLDTPNTPIWKRVYWRKMYLVPVLTPKHMQLIGIQYMTPTSIRICSWQSSISEKELNKCLYTYLPWVKSVQLYSAFYAKFIPNLKTMCVPLTVYGILNIHQYAKTNGCTDVYTMFLKLYESLVNKSDEQIHQVVMDAWHSVIRPA